MSSLIGEEGEKSSEKKEGELETEKEDVENEVKESVAQKLGRADLISPEEKEEMKLAPALPELVADENVPEPLPGEPEGLPTEPSDLEEVGSGLLPSPAAGDGPGEVEGVVFDSDGNGIPGVIITLPDEGGFQVRTDEEGRFRITGLPASGVSAEFLKSAYVTKVDVMQVKEEGVTKVRVSLELKPVELAEGEYLLEGREVILDYEEDEFGGISLGNSESPSFVSGIGKEEFAKQNVSDVGDAVGKVTGANIVGGRYAVIRGLADRYVVTTVNGALISSADPSRKAVQLDLFPTSAVERIDVFKKYSPDLPGDFGGGTIDIRFLRFPKEPLLQFSYKTGYATELNGGDFYTHPDRDLGFLGDVNDPLPPGFIFSDPNAEKPTFIGGNANSPDPQAAEAWQGILNRQGLLPRTDSAEPSHSMGFTLGNTYELGEDRRFGFVLSAQRKTEDKINLNAERGQPSPLREWVQDDYSRSLEWGLLASGGLQIAEGHTVGLAYFKKRIVSDNLTHGRRVVFPEDGWTWGSIQSDQDFIDQYGAAAYQSGDFWRIDPTIRELEMFQADGSHRFGERGIKFDWSVTDATSLESRPQSSTFNRSVLDFADPILIETRNEAIRILDEEQAPEFANLIVSRPDRFGDIIPNITNPNEITWNELRSAIVGNALAERLAGNRETAAGLIPVNPELGQIPLVSNAEVNPANSAMFTNILSQEIEETTEERRFGFEVPFYFDDDSDDRRIVFSNGFRSLSKERRSRGVSANLQFNLLDPEDADRQGPDFLASLSELLAADPSLIPGFIDGQREGNPFFTNGLTFEARNFNGESNLDAYYAMGAFHWDEWWVKGGFRYEEEERSYYLLPDPFNVLSPSDRETGAGATVFEDAILPSLALGRSFDDEKYKLDFAWSETVARPTFFEFIPAFTLDQASQGRRRGNFFLTQSEIHNFDIGFEYAHDDENLLRVGVFHKKIDAPIVEIYQESAGVTVFDNGETAEISGIELEWQHDLGGPWSITGNYTYIDATLNYFVTRSGIDDRELLSTRFPYQPEHILNLNLGYDHEDSGWSANLIYNLTGGYPILLRNSISGGDIVQNEQHSLDFVLRKKWEEDWGDFTMSFGVENLLESERILTYEGGSFDGSQSDADFPERQFFISGKLSF